MSKKLLSLAALFAGTAILLVGHGLQLTLLPIRANAFGWTAQAIGMTGSAYFVGFVTGCFTVPGLVARVGHVRVFMVLTAVATSALLGVAILDAFGPWLVLRFGTGWAIAGLYLVIESWLNEQATNAERGAVLSTYTVVVLTAMIGGQAALNLAPPESTDIVVVGTLFICLAALPVGLSRAPAPQGVPTARFSLRRVYRASHAAVGGTFIAGLVTGVFFTLAPVFGRNLGFDVATVTIMMMVGILGGALLQLPLGRLSDRIDRRRVLQMTMAAGAGVCVLGTVLTGPWATLGVMFLLGGAALPIYAICLAHANDNAEGNFLEIGTGILIVNAFGSILGPMLASIAMERLGTAAFFWYSGLCLGIGAVWMTTAIRRRPALRPYYAPFTSAAETTQGAFELDPRNAPDAMEEGSDEN